MKDMRVKLKKGQTIRLSAKQSGENAKIFTIDSVINAGGTVVCYEAGCGEKKGILKELYPEGAVPNGQLNFCFQRDEDNHLFPAFQKDDAAFLELKKDFIDAYLEIEQIKKLGPDYKLLNNYLPSYEILYGAAKSKEQQSTVYLWNPDATEGIVFQDFLNGIKKDPGKNPVTNLRIILTALISLCECLCLIHRAGYLHLDLKPVNFLMAKRGDGSLNPEHISLFDTNSIYNISLKKNKFSLTEGFYAPGLRTGQVSNKSDIYSVGTILYKALMLSDPHSDTEAAADLFEMERRYGRQDYMHLREQLQESPLINAAKIDEESRFRSTLLEILEQSLARIPMNRYEDCESLIVALKRARSFLPGEDAALLKDADSYKNPEALLSNLLYQNPLFDYVLDNKECSGPTLDVLVLGKDENAYRFIDLALQAAQVPGFFLRLDIASPNAEENKKIFLENRPALSDFVDVDGSLEGEPEKEAYAKIRFLQLPISTSAFSEQEDDLRKDIEWIFKSTADSGYNYTYAFISTGSKVRNKQAADATEKYMKDKVGDESDYLVVFSAEEGCREKAHSFPVYPGRAFKKSLIDEEMKTRAQNVHLVWAGNSNGDLQEALKEFKDKKNPYHYNASLFFAMSLKYKLWSAGILEEDPESAAQEFVSRLRKDKTFLDILAAYEHRRWVIEKVTGGWTKTVNYQTIIDEGVIQDKEAKMHPCIVRSEAKTGLSGSAYHISGKKSWDKGAWDKDTQNCKVETLDELDRMSVELHRAFHQKAAEVRETIFDSYPYRELKEMYEKKIQEPKEYYKWEFCLKQVCEGDLHNTKQYQKFAEELLKAADRKEKEDVGICLKRIQKLLFPVIQNNYYRDYKKADYDLIKEIPFILTNEVEPHIIMALEDDRLGGGRNNEIFKNVASSAILKPGKADYLYYVDNNTNIQILLDTVQKVKAYLLEKNSKCRIGLYIVYDSRTDEQKIRRIKKAFREEKKVSLTLRACTGMEEAAALFADYCKENPQALIDGSTSPFDSRISNAHLFSQIEELKMRYFEFDSEKKEFSVLEHLLFPKFIDTADAFISVEDLLRFNQAESLNYYAPKLEKDYETLWTICTANSTEGKERKRYLDSVSNWNKLCKILGDLKNKKEGDLIVRFTFDFDADNNMSWTSSSFDSVYREKAKILLNLLVKGTVIKPDYQLINDSSDSFRIKAVIRRKKHKETVEQLICEQSFLLGSDFYLNHYRDWNEVAAILFNGLKVEKLDISKEKNKAKLKKILSMLQEKQLIKHYEEDDNEISFEYRDKEIKSVLTQEGALLEVYTYYKTLETAIFDDGFTGFEFGLKGALTGNELDGLYTSGFQTLFVECKNTQHLDQNYYHKLYSLAQQFGINAKVVVVANTYNMYHEAVENNRKQIDRGERMGIITVHKKEDINDIGNVLKAIMKGER